MITKSKYWKHTKIYNAFKIELNIFFFLFFVCPSFTFYLSKL